jgi:hypothetical protein
LTNYGQRLTDITYDDTGGIDKTSIDNNVYISKNLDVSGNINISGDTIANKISAGGAPILANRSVSVYNGLAVGNNISAGYGSSRPMNVVDTAGVINITRVTTNAQAGFEMQTYNPNTLLQTSNVLFLGGDQLGDSLQVLMRTGGDKFVFKITPTLFDLGSTSATPSLRVRGTYAQIDGKIQQPLSTTTNEMRAITMYADQDLTQQGTGKIVQSATAGTNTLGAITMNSNTNLTQSGTGIISQSGTGTNQLKTTTITGNATITGTLTLNSGSVSINTITTNTLTVNDKIIHKDGTETHSRHGWYPMDIHDEMTFYTNFLTKPKTSSYNASAVTNTNRTLNQNTVFMMLVKLIKGETYTGVVWYSPLGAANKTMYCALYEAGDGNPNPDRLARSTTGQTPNGGLPYFKSINFDTPYTSPETKYACVMLVCSNSTWTVWTYDNGDTNYGRTALANNITLSTSYYTGFTTAGNFPATFSGTPVANTWKVWMGLF